MNFARMTSIASRSSTTEKCIARLLQPVGEDWSASSSASIFQGATFWRW